MEQSSFLWHLQICQPPFSPKLIVGMSVQKKPKKCGWSWSLGEELHVGFPPAVFRKGLVNVLWLLLHCVQPLLIISCCTESAMVCYSSGISARGGSHLNLIRIILTTSSNWLPCFTQINMLQPVFKTFQKKTTKRACHLTFPIPIGLHNIG